MTFQVLDCLSETEAARKSSKPEADAICEAHGGNANCFYVFEVEEKQEEKPVKVVEKIEEKPLPGMLF